MRVAIKCRLGRSVGQVYAFAEHVTVHRRFGRGDPKTLREDTTKVGSPRSMPEKPAITVLDLSEMGVQESLVLSLALDAEDIL